jgi:hypothetical protein
MPARLCCGRGGDFTRYGRFFLWGGGSIQFSVFSFQIPKKKAVEDYRSPKPGGYLCVSKFAVASWSATVLCRFDGRHEQAREIPLLPRWTKWPFPNPASTSLRR